MGWKAVCEHPFVTQGRVFQAWHWEDKEGNFRSIHWNPIQDANHHAEAYLALDPAARDRVEIPEHDYRPGGTTAEAAAAWIHLTEEGRRAFWNAWAERTSHDS